MGKFLAITLFGLVLLVNPAFAGGFSFTDTYHSVWNNSGTRLEIVSNPEDDFAHWTNANTNLDVFCFPISKKATTAAFNCEGKPLILRFDSSSGQLYANDFPYDRIE